jgi:hypothetical protein
VSYGIRFEGNALAQLHRFPPAAFDALLDRVVLLVDAPWDAYLEPGCCGTATRPRRSTRCGCPHRRYGPAGYVEDL